MGEGGYLFGLASRGLREPWRTSRGAISRIHGTVAEREEPDLNANFEIFVKRLNREWHENWPIVIVVDGARMGVGKSTLAIQLCRRLDPNFALEQIVFRGRDLEALYARLPPWRMTVLDEPRGLMASRGMRDRELLHVVGAIGSVRKNRIGTLLLAPKKELFDSLVLSGIAPYWIFIERRGVGRVHRAWTGATYKKSQSRVPYDHTRVDKIGFGSLDRDPFFRDYNDYAQEANRRFYAEVDEERRSGGRGRAAPPPTTGANRQEETQRPPARPELIERRLCPNCGKSVRIDNFPRHARREICRRSATGAS